MLYKYIYFKYYLEEALEYFQTLSLSKSYSDLYFQFLFNNQKIWPHRAEIPSCELLSDKTFTVPTTF